MSRQSPLRDAHAAAGARFTDFGGWEMPVEFDSIRTEHAAVREAVGKFDVSHMGQIAVSGPDAAELTDRLTTNDVGALDPGDGQYAAITDERGAMLDDTVVYRRGPESYLFVPNAGHDRQMYDRWVDYRDEWGLDADVEDETAATAMVAVQGPDAVDCLAATTDHPVDEVGRFEAAEATVAGTEALVARTGYTGEDGFEVMLPAADAETLWEALDAQPCGLGARDTLRTEMGFLLSGQDFDPEENPRNPYEAGIGFVVKLDTDFVGKNALAEVVEDGPAERFVGLEPEGRRVPRHGYPVESTDGEAIGEVTSGTMSPTLERPIGLGYLPVAYAEEGTEVQVVIRGEAYPASVVEPPFLER